MMIGPSWLTITDSDGRRRLDDRDDMVCLEVERALALKIRLVIPVLVRGATVPSSNDLPRSLAGLSKRQVFQLSDHRWSVDVDIP